MVKLGGGMPVITPVLESTSGQHTISSQLFIRSKFKLWGENVQSKIPVLLRNVLNSTLLDTFACYCMYANFPPKMSSN